jgi:hypothetical protein
MEGVGSTSSSLKTLKKLDFDFKKLTACNEPFSGIVPDKAAYP